MWSPFFCSAAPLLFLLLLQLCSTTTGVAHLPNLPPPPPPPSFYLPVTADYLVLQFHFENTSNTLGGFVGQMEQLPKLFNYSHRVLLPSVVVWRVIAPGYRSNSTHGSIYPSMDDNIMHIRRLSRLYATAKPPQKLR